MTRHLLLRTLGALAVFVAAVVVGMVLVQLAVDAFRSEPSIVEPIELTPAPPLDELGPGTTVPPSTTESDPSPLRPAPGPTPAPTVPTLPRPPAQTLLPPAPLPPASVDDDDDDDDDDEEEDDDD